MLFVLGPGAFQLTHSLNILNLKAYNRGLGMNFLAGEICTKVNQCDEENMRKISD